MTFSIAIIGAGPAGCTLARLLSLSEKDIKVTIFESEPSLDFRSQGGTLDLRTGSGLDAIKAAKLFDEFSKYARYDGEALKVADKNMLCYLKMNGSKSEKDYARPEIDRPQLRRILFESLPADCVKWGHKLVEVDEKLNLHFTDKPTQGGFDLIVGADGAWSKTRARISDAKPFYSGVGGYSMLINNPEKDHKELYDLVNRGSIFAYSDSKHICAQQMGDGSIVVSTLSARPEDWQKETDYDINDSAAARAAIKEEYGDWNSQLLELTQVATGGSRVWNLYMLPLGHKWQHVRGITTIGDAAHLATPFAGQGVNTALQDALLLSKAIIKSVDAKDQSQALDRAVAAFEQDMFKRGEWVQRITNDNLQGMVLSKGGPKDGIERFVLGAVEDDFGWALWLVKPIVYTYFSIFKLIYA